MEITHIGALLKGFVGRALMPFPLAFIALVISAVLLWLPRCERTGRWLLTATVIFFLAITNTFVSTKLIAPLESSCAFVPDYSRTEDLPPSLRACKVIVVLGSGNGDAPGRAAIDELGAEGLARLTTAIRMARLLPSARVIFSGSTPEDRLPHARVMKAAAISLGLAPWRITLIEGVRDTVDETRRLGSELQGQRFILITSAAHLPRAVSLCRKQGLNPIPIPTDFLATPGNSTESHALPWDYESLHRTTSAAHEYLGLLWTRLRNQR